MDSLAALKAVLGRAKTVSALVKEIREALSTLGIRRLTLLHVHSHIGVEGHELVDRLASDGRQVLGPLSPPRHLSQTPFVREVQTAAWEWWRAFYRERAEEDAERSLGNTALRLLQILEVPTAGRVVEVPPEFERWQVRLLYQLLAQRCPLLHEGYRGPGEQAPLCRCGEHCTLSHALSCKRLAGTAILLGAEEDELQVVRTRPREVFERLRAAGIVSHGPEATSFAMRVQSAFWHKQKEFRKREKQQAPAMQRHEPTEFQQRENQHAPVTQRHGQA
eukprot:6491295-Amphidinium_carterae.3